MTVRARCTLTCALESVLTWMHQNHRRQDDFHFGKINCSESGGFSPRWSKPNSLMGFLTQRDLAILVVALFFVLVHIRLSYRPSVPHILPGAVPIASRSHDSRGAPVASFLAKVSPSATGALREPRKSVLVVTHTLEASGAPRLATDSASMLTANFDVSFFCSHPNATVEGQRRLVGPLIQSVSSSVDFSKYDVVLCHSIATYSWILDLGKVVPRARVVLWMHESDQYEDESKGASVTQLREVAPHLSALLHDSWTSYSWTARKLIDLQMPPVHRVIHWGLSEEKLEGLENDFGQLEPHRVRKQLKISDKAFVFLSLGSWTKRKGNEGIIKSFRSLDCSKSAHLIIAGCGISAADQQDMTEERVHLLDCDTHGWRVGQLLAAADAFVSHSFSLQPLGGENWGLGSLEAASLGLPLLLPNVGGPTEQFSQNVSCLFHAPMSHVTYDARELSRNMCSLLSDEPLRKRLGIAAQNRLRSAFPDVKMRSELNAALSAVLKHSTKEEISNSVALQLTVSPFEKLSTRSDTRYKNLESIFWIQNHVPTFLGGYSALETVGDVVQKWQPESESWTTITKFDNLRHVASHANALVFNNGRTVVLAGGQVGAACDPATDKVLVLDLERRTALSSVIPALPQVVYSALFSKVSLGGDRYRLHVTGGAKADRISPIRWHLTLDVKEAKGKLKALQAEWQSSKQMPPLPFAAHAASWSTEKFWFVYGGLLGHVDTTCKVFSETQLHYADEEYGAMYSGTYIHFKSLFRYNFENDTWMRLSDSPLDSSHNQPVVLPRNRVLFVGGSRTGDFLSGVIQEYLVDEDEWRVHRGALPLGVKGGIIWSNEDSIFYCGGQFSFSKTNHLPSQVSNQCMKAKYSFEEVRA